MGKRQSRPWIVSDELWSLIEPLLPEPGPKLVAGRPRVPDRQALCAILFVLHTGIQWEYLPQELGFGSGMTCWRRLAAWNEAGVWEKLHLALLKKLRSAKQLDWSRAVIDSSRIRAARRGPKAVPARSTAHDRADLALADERSSPTERLRIAFAAQADYRRCEQEPNATAVYRQVKNLVTSPPRSRRTSTPWPWRPSSCSWASTGPT